MAYGRNRKTEAGHKAGRTGRKCEHRADRKRASNHARRAASKVRTEEMHWLDEPHA